MFSWLNIHLSYIQIDEKTIDMLLGYIMFFVLKPIRFFQMVKPFMRKYIQDNSFTAK